MTLNFNYSKINYVFYEYLIIKKQKNSIVIV